MIHSLLVDDLMVEGVTRKQVREHVDGVLLRPVGEDEAKEWDEERRREGWGLSPEALRDAAIKDQMFEGELKLVPNP